MSDSHGFILSCKLQWKKEQSDNSYFARWFTSQHKANEIVRISTPGNDRCFDTSTGKGKLTPSLTRLIQMWRTDLCLLSDRALETFREDVQAKLQDILWGILMLVEFSKVWMYTGQKFWNCCHCFPALTVGTLKNWTFLSICFCPRIRNVFLESKSDTEPSVTSFFTNINNFPPSMTIVKPNKLTCCIHVFILLKAQGKVEEKYFNGILVWVIINGRLIEDLFRNSAYIFYSFTQHKKLFDSF